MPTYLRLQQYDSAHQDARVTFEDATGVAIVDRDLTSPPSTPAEGARYIPATSSTGAWSGKDGQVATSYDGGATWTFVVPHAGMEVWIVDEAVPRVWNGSAWIDPLLSSRSPSFRLTVTDPSNAEDLTLAHCNKPFTITKVVAVVRGTSPSVTWTLRKASDRSAVGTEVVTGGTTTTSQTSGDVIVAFNSATIAAGDFLWLETSALSGTVQELHVTVHAVQTSP